MKPFLFYIPLLILSLSSFNTPAQSTTNTPPTNTPPTTLPQIKIAPDAQTFTRNNKPFTIWGVNYDHDSQGQLLEDYWHTHWPTIVNDFKEIRELGANAVRIHLQLNKFMLAPDKPNPRELEKLNSLCKLAIKNNLYLNLTGLACYHKKDTPPWYDQLSESQRWETQANFWQAIAQTTHNSSAIFCYDLMNEPILPGNKPATDWLAGELAGKHFVQRIALELNNRTRKQIATAWINKMHHAIRQHDQKHFITVGVIPWVQIFPNAKPTFYDPDVAKNLDIVSVHFYPQKDKLPQTLKALKAYDIGKPIIIEEIFPLKASPTQTIEFINAAKPHTAGIFSFYWGKTAQQLRDSEKTIANAITAQWLEHFKKHAPPH